MHNWPLHPYQVGESMMIVCSTYADLTALTALTGLVGGAVYGTGGRAAVGDGGYGHWRYSASATDMANGGTLLAIDGGGAGRFFRLDVGTYIDVRWFGLKLDGTTNSTQTWQNIITAAGTIPADIYRRRTTIAAFSTLMPASESSSTA